MSGHDFPESERWAAPPRANGELVFEAPWESRAFGLVHALCDAGTLGWEEFRQALIAEISAWERESSGREYRYYERWLAAAETLLQGREFVARADLEAKASELAARDDHAGSHSHT